MFGFLGFLLIIFLLIVFIGFTILGNILRVLFGIGKRPPYQNRTSTHQKQNTYTQTQANDENENFAEFLHLLQIDILIRRETEKKSLMRMRESM